MERRSGKPTPVGAIVNEIDTGVDRFPFFWWAVGAKFEYPEAARHLFARTGSAAEAFFLRAFATRPGATFDDCAVTVGHVTCTPQASIDRYRVDFTVRCAELVLAVEVDGLHFHHRMESQIQSDYARARRIIAAGFPVVRFTAREVFDDSHACWLELDSIIDGSRVYGRTA